MPFYEVDVINMYSFPWSWGLNLRLVFPFVFSLASDRCVCAHVVDYYYCKRGVYDKCQSRLSTFGKPVDLGIFISSGYIGNNRPRRRPVCYTCALDLPETRKLTHHPEAEEAVDHSTENSNP